VGRDRQVLEAARFVNRIFSTEGLPVYEFRFSYVAETLRSQWTGAHHASEVPYVFNTLPEEYGADKVTEHDRQVGATMIKYWTNFMKTGDPNGAGLPVWPKFDTKGDMLMNFTAAGTPVAMPDPIKNRLDIVSESVSAVPTTPKR
jgi:para-nitrobenzyl esterase